MTLFPDQLPKFPRDDGSIANNFHGFYSDKGIGIRPVIVIPKENIEKQGDEWEIKK